MKRILSFLVLAFCCCIATAQEITYQDFKSIIQYLPGEDFKTAFEKSGELLKSHQQDSSDMRAIVTYINIYAAAGMVSLGQMTHEGFNKNALRYIGQRVVMSAHPCIDSTKRGPNNLQITRKDGQWVGFTIASNSKNTSILCFEYYYYNPSIDPAEYIGRNVRSGGILDKVEVNPNKSTIWIARLHISNAFARVLP